MQNGEERNDAAEKKMVEQRSAKNILQTTLRSKDTK
jgi:hypothetical protein